MALALALALLAQDVDQQKVDDAIKRGVQYLKKQVDYLPVSDEGARKIRCHELVLWTFVHAGVPEDDPAFEKLLATVLESPLERTYSVSLAAMVLEELDRARYQEKILACAQFLVDNQAKDGRWSYGDPSLGADETWKKAKPGVATDGGKLGADGRREKPRVGRRLPIKRSREGPESGDNSNSQYAALGLRACHDAGIVLPKTQVQLAVRWWREAQNQKDKGAGRGWGYLHRDDRAAWGSMTAGGVGSLAIGNHILGDDPRRDRSLQAGLEWLTAHYSLRENPGFEPRGRFLYYYLYALERAAILCGQERLGGRDWYAEGAKMLVEAQQADGHWAGEGGVWEHDTCFAILFLRRATRPLEDVATPGGRKK